MRVRYISTADPSDDAVCHVFGQRFPLMDWVEVDAATFRKLRHNQTFEADGNLDGKADQGKGQVGGDVDELRAQLTALGVKFHPFAGVAKLTEKLEAAKAAQA